MTPLFERVVVVVVIEEPCPRSLERARLGRLPPSPISLIVVVVVDDLPFRPPLKLNLPVNRLWWPRPEPYERRDRLVLERFVVVVIVLDSLILVLPEGEEVRVISIAISRLPELLSVEFGGTSAAGVVWICGGDATGASAFSGAGPLPATGIVVGG